MRTKTHKHTKTHNHVTYPQTTLIRRQVPLTIPSSCTHTYDTHEIRRLSSPYSRHSTFISRTSARIILKFLGQNSLELVLSPQALSRPRTIRFVMPPTPYIDTQPAAPTPNTTHAYPTTTHTHAPREAQVKTSHAHAGHESTHTHTQQTDIQTQTHPILRCAAARCVLSQAPSAVYPASRLSTQVSWCGCLAAV
jgi:hypothetical protein